MLRIAMRCGCVGLFVALSASSLPAADEKPVDRKKFAVTDVAQADADFAVQGEYSGSLFGDYGFAEWAGLQVIARGDGKFEAVEYRGGLPGDGWDGFHKRAYTGETGEAGTILRGENRSIILQNGIAFVYDGAGRYLGQLPKFHRRSPTLGAPPAPGARVLFDGTTVEHFKNGKMTEDGLLMIGADTIEPVGDFYLHLEFRTPYMPYARGQGRGNSGVYIQGRYEVQILDSFGLEGVENECGGLYKTKAPDVNMCLPPLEWQTYDIDFRAARFDSEGNKVADARLTVWHNGVPIHNHVAIPNKTGAGAKEGPEPRPIRLQNHGNPVHFRNIWLVDYSAPQVVEPGSYAAAYAAVPAVPCNPAPYCYPCGRRRCRCR